MKSRFSGLLACVLALSALTSLPASARSSSKGSDTSFEPISLYSASQRSNTFAGCKDLFPSEAPIDPGMFGQYNAIGLCSDTFASVYSQKTKTPLVVVERLTRSSLKEGKGLERTDKFFPDPRVGSRYRAHPQDYTRSGYDRGHMAPAADSADENGMAQSFAMSNIVPQAPQNNRKTWSRIESDTRKFVARAVGPVYVYSGVLFQDNGANKIGKNEVWVPTHLYKVVYSKSEGRAWAYYLQNTDEARVTAPMDYRQFVATTGLNLIPELK